MSGLLQSTFQNFRKFPKMIDVDVLVVGSGGAGAQGGLLGGGAYVSGLYHNATTYYASGGHNGGNAGYSGMVVSGQTKIMSSSTYSITIAPGAIYDPAGNAAGIGTNGSPSYINGPFPDSVSSSMVKNFTNNVVGSTVVVGGFPGVINAAGGLGGIGQGGGSLLSHAFPPAYLGRTTTSTVFASNISGTNSYYGNGNTGGGLSGGGPATAAAGANATNYGQGGGGDMAGFTPTFPTVIICPMAVMAGIVVLEFLLFVVDKVILFRILWLVVLPLLLLRMELSIVYLHLLLAVL